MMTMPKGNGYSVLNLIMDIVMVITIVVFLNVSLRLVPERQWTQRIVSLKSPITKVYEKMYSSSLQSEEVRLVSDSTTKQVRVLIGSALEATNMTSASSVSHFLRAGVFEVAKAKRIIPESTTVDTIDIASVVRSSSIIKKYYGGTEESYVTPRGFIHNDAYPYDITLVAILSIVNIGEVVKISNYWSGPINVCIYADTYEESYPIILSIIDSEALQGRVTLTVVYSPLFNVIYPVNVLKNIAISTVFTTHFIEIDISMLPSKFLYDKLRKIPVSVLYEPINLVVLPVFYGEEESLDADNLNQCLEKKNCIPKYSFMMKSWFETNTDAYYMREMTCLEPGKTYYFLRRHNSFNILYDENFLIRGYDHIQLLDSLRNDGYIFHLLRDEYFIDTSIRLEVENAALQLLPDNIKLLNEHRGLLSHNRVVHITDCMGTPNSHSIVNSYFAFLESDEAARKKEEASLKKVLDKMKNGFDVFTWNRRVAAIVSERKSRFQKNY